MSIEGAKVGIDIYTPNRRFDGILDDAIRGQLILSSHYSDLVIASSAANADFGSTLTFVTSDPNSGRSDPNSKPATFHKWVINQGNWGAMKDGENVSGAKLEFGYSDSNKENPHFVIRDGTEDNTVLTLDGKQKRVGIGTREPRTTLDVAGTITIRSGTEEYELVPIDLTERQARIEWPDWILENFVIKYKEWQSSLRGRRWAWAPSIYYKLPDGQLVQGYSTFSADSAKPQYVEIEMQSSPLEMGWEAIRETSVIVLSDDPNDRQIKINDLPQVIVRRRRLPSDKKMLTLMAQEVKEATT